MYLDPTTPAATITFHYCLFMNHAPMDSDIAYVSTLHTKVQGFLLFPFSPEVERVVSATVEVILFSKVTK